MWDSSDCFSYVHSFFKYGSCYILLKHPQYEILNIGLSDRFMINHNQWRASSGSFIHIRNSGVQICFKICKEKDGIALGVTFAFF
jgi:hypothetical protein